MNHIVPLVVIDDQPIVHTGVRCWVAEASVLTGAVHAYRSVPEFLAQHQRNSTATEVIIYDPEHGELRPDYAGLQQLSKLNHRVVAYSRIASAEIILSCLDAGAANYIVKSESPEHLIEAITAAQLGTESRGPLAAAAEQAAQQYGRPELTAQERRVLIEWLLTTTKTRSARNCTSRRALSGPTYSQFGGATARSTAQPPPRRRCSPGHPDGLIGTHDV